MSYKPVDTAITMVVGPLIDDTDFKSLEEAIAYNAAGMDVSLIVEKTDGTTAVTAITLTTGGTSDWTHKDGGYYEIEVTAAQNPEEGIGYIRGVCTGVLPFESAHYNIVPANTYDSLIKGTDLLQTDIAQLVHNSTSAADLKDFADAGYDPSSNKITGCKVNDDMVGAAPTVTAIRQEMDTNSTKMAPSQTLNDYKATGFSVPNEYDTVIAALQTDLDNPAQYKATGFSTHSAADVKTAIEAAGSHLALILADTGELQTDWKNGGRLDALIDLILGDTSELQGNQANWATATGFAVPGEYDTPMGYIPSDLGSVPTATELIAAHGSGAWTTADVSALATSSEVAAVPSDVWDEILTGATHNIATSAGRRVREIGAYSIHSGTAQAGDSNSITIAASASPSNPLYNGIFNRNLIVLVDNTGVGQTRTIVDYDAVTKVCVVDRDWRITPDATTTYQITPDDTPLTVDHGVARGGTSRTITIRAYAASDDDAYLCNIVTIIAGAGRGQARLVDSYDGTTKVVTICGDDWVVNPDTTSIYVMMPYGVACAACMGSESLTQIADCVWDDDLTTHTTPNSASWFIQKIKSIANFIRIKLL